MRRLGSFLAVASVLLLALPGVAQEERTIELVWVGKPEVGTELLDDLADDAKLREKLGITEAQAEKLRALAREAAKFRIRHQADIAVKQMELEELLEAEAPDRALIEKKVGEISDLQHAIFKSRIDYRLALQDVLTPEQRTKMRALLRERRRTMRMRGMEMERMEMMRQRMRRAPTQPPEPPEP